MTDDEIIAVVQAHKEGKQIQAVGVCEGDRDINWRDVHLFYWDFQHYNYRVKPEPRKPREWWAEVYPDGSGQIFADTRSLTNRGEIIRVTEQLQPDKVWCS